MMLFGRFRRIAGPEWTSPMSDVVLSKGIRSNLLSLQNASALQERAQTRLSTGRKVNNRARRSAQLFPVAVPEHDGQGPQPLLDNMGLGIETLKKTDAALVGMTRLIEQMQAGLRNALNSNATNAKLASGHERHDEARARLHHQSQSALGTMTPPGPVNAGDVMNRDLTVPSNPVVGATNIAITMAARCRRRTPLRSWSTRINNAPVNKPTRRPASAMSAPRSTRAAASSSTTPRWARCGSSGRRRPRTPRT